MAQNPADKDKVMHAQLVAPNGFWLMASDTPQSIGAPKPNGQISLSGSDEAELRGYWDKLSQGGSIGLPLEKRPGATASACSSTSSVMPVDGQHRQNPAIGCAAPVRLY